MDETLIHCVDDHQPAEVVIPIHFPEEKDPV